MKVLTRKEFLALEGPVLYSKWYKDHEGPSTEFSIKYQNMGTNDWVCQVMSGFDLQDADADINSGDIWRHVAEGEWDKDLKVDMDFAGRDGLYETEEECKFVVFDLEDLKIFMGKLKDCFNRALAYSEDYVFKPLAVHGRLMRLHLIEKLTEEDKGEIHKLIRSMIEFEPENAKANLNELINHTFGFLSTNYSTKAYINAAIVAESNKLNGD